MGSIYGDLEDAYEAGSRAYGIFSWATVGDMKYNVRPSEMHAYGTRTVPANDADVLLFR
jgi:hypothetical protein